MSPTALIVTVSRDCENDGLAPHSIPLLGVVNAIKAIVEAMRKERTTGSEALHRASVMLTEPRAPVSGEVVGTCSRASKLYCGSGSTLTIWKMIHCSGKQRKEGA